MIKKCNCCGKSYTKQQWGQLRYVDVTKVPAGLDPIAEPAYELEQRNCSCNSTLGLEHHNV